MVKASELRVWDAQGNVLEGAAREAALNELRETGGMVERYLADTTGASTPEEWDDLSNAGPATDEIDWTS